MYSNKRNSCLAGICMLAFFLSCTGSKPEIPVQTVDLPNKQFELNNGLSFYQGKRFSGITVEKYPSEIIYRTTSYFNGRQEGHTLVRYPNGRVESLRYYHNGEKEGVHTGWWPNGNKRYEYYFTAGNYNGTFSEWYESGKKFRIIRYRNGKELKGYGWRDNGKIYMSFVMKDGRRYGLINARLCYSLKKEKGEY